MRTALLIISCTQSCTAVLLQPVVPARPVISAVHVRRARSPICQDDTLPDAAVASEPDLKTILITGAGTGLGAGSSLGLAKAGHTVIASCLNDDQMTSLEAKAKEEGVTLHIEKMDVTVAADRDAVFKKWGDKVDIIVANAAIGEGGPIAEIPTSLVRNNFEVNVFSQLDFVQPYAAVFVKKGAGKIIFTSSIAGLIVFPYLACYCMTKFALEAMAQGLQQELAGTGVKVCTINPGPFTTGFNDYNINRYQTWYDPDKNFTPKENVEGMAYAMAEQLQYDPKLMYDRMIELIPADTHRFREVYTPDCEVMCKEGQAKTWAMDINGETPDTYWGKDVGMEATKPAIMKASEVRALGL